MTQSRRVLDNPWIILALLFLATGVLGIPILWISNAFGKPAKVIISSLVTLYTAALVYATYLVLVWSWGRIEQSL